MILSHWLFVKAMRIYFSYVFNDGNYNVNFELHPESWMVVMVTIVSVDARWIESRFVVTAYNIEIVSCDFHGTPHLVWKSLQKGWPIFGFSLVKWKIKICFGLFNLVCARFQNISFSVLSFPVSCNVRTLRSKWNNASCKIGIDYPKNNYSKYLLCWLE